MDILKRIIGLILIFGVINLVLWGGQELYYRKDTQEINRIEKLLDQEKIEITKLQSRINSLSTEIDSKQAELDRYENTGMIDSYNTGVDSYNSLLDEYKSKVDVYNDKLIEYNRNIEQVNILIQKSSSRWYLIPIPLPGKSTKTKL